MGSTDVVDSSLALPYMEIHMIDFSLLTSPSPDLASEELKKLHLALKSWGCFQLVNHGMSAEFLDEVRNMGKKFFALPEEEKEKYARIPPDHQGYGIDAIGGTENVPLKWQYRLSLVTYPLEKRKPDRWPQTPHSFRETCHEYTMNIKKLHDKMVQAMARCLNVRENAFLEEYGAPTEIISRYQLYVPCSLFDHIRTSSKHSDASTVTFLLQDKEIEGLEVEKDGQWFKAPVIPHALFVNVGDLMEIMSNGIFKSAVHRVVPNPEKGRTSLALFCCSPEQNEVGPLKELVTDDQPAIYQRVKNYRDIFFRYHPIGIRPITTLKI